MSTTTDEHGRPEPPFAAGEAETLLGFLDYQRATLEWKTRGLDEELRLPLAGHPTGMTLAGLLKHLAWVEDFWFTETAGGDVPPTVWADVDWDANQDWEWTSACIEEAHEVRSTWQASVARSRAITERLLGDAGSGLDGRHPAWGGRAQVSLRWILLHMVEEYARHNGHADLLREAVDGEVGE